jgi:3-methyladenine DNA glycosylase AlkD
MFGIMPTRKLSIVRSNAKPGTSAAKTARATPRESGAVGSRVAFAQEWLEQKSTRRDRDNLVRFAIVAPSALGVSMANLKVLAKQLGRDHELAAALWRTGQYEARMLATLIDEPELVSAAQMDAWCRDFDNWAICDTACFALFDRTPHAWRKVASWSTRKDEFPKRAAFALLACLALHDKSTADAPFAKLLRLVADGARDERNFVKKGVNWALRAVGRRSPALHANAVALARRLAGSEDAAPRWVGKAALRELTSAAVRKKLARVAKSGKAKKPGTAGVLGAANASAAARRKSAT